MDSFQTVAKTRWQWLYKLARRASRANFIGYGGHRTVILVASEAMTAFKQPQRSLLTSDLNSLTLNAYIFMLFGLLNAANEIIAAEEEKWLPLTSVALHARW